MIEQLSNFNWDDYTFRCSSLGKIMVNAKGKSHKQMLKDAYLKTDKKLVEYNKLTDKAIKTKEKLEKELDALDVKIEYLKTVQDIPLLSDTCKTHLCDIYTEVKYGRYEDVVSKYIEKGLMMEEKAITQYCLLNGEMHKKNKERKFNKWIEGETDFFDDVYVRDTKVNWSIFQFIRTLSKPLNKLYHWQMDGYLWLWDRKKGEVIYVLLDTPEHLIDAEITKQSYTFVGTEEEWNTAKVEIRKNHIYSDIPLEEKIIPFSVERSEERIEQIKTRVEECRWFLNNFDKLKNLKEDERDDPEDGEQEMAA